MNHNVNITKGINKDFLRKTNHMPKRFPAISDSQFSKLIGTKTAKEYKAKQRAFNARLNALIDTATQKGVDMQSALGKTIIADSIHNGVVHPKDIAKAYKLSSGE